MAKLFGQHWPHLIFVVVGVAVFLWTAYRPEPDRAKGQPTSVAAGRSDAARMSVRRTAARRGLFALGPLLGAAATGAVLYGLDVGGNAVPGAVAWVHSGISLLALLLVAYKVTDLGLARMRRAFTRQRLAELASIILGALSVPLLVTGVGLLAAPSTHSFFAYSHLISSAWWTGLMLWHLRRYLRPSLRASRARTPAAGATGSKLALAPDAGKG
jgi:hypothetical protein